MVWTRKRKAKKSMRSLLRKNPRRRSRKRKNAWYNAAKKHSAAARLGWRKRKAKKATKKRARKNPFYGRKHKSVRKARRNPIFRRRRSTRRRTRRNPFSVSMIKSIISKNWIMQAATIGGGIVAGAVAMPLINSIVPDSMKQYRKFFGLLHVILGGVMYGMVRNARLKTVGAVVAGTGVYDLIASNVPQLGLAPLPSTVPFIPAKLIGGSPAQPQGMNYYPSLSANYEVMGLDYAGAAQTQGFQGDREMSDMYADMQ